MKQILKLLWKFHREKFLDFAVAEFYENIPKKIVEPALTILSEKRQKVDQLFLYQTYILQRRIARTPKEVDMIFGMLANIKLTQHMISGGKGIPEEGEDVQPASRAQEERERKEELEKAIEGVKAFQKKRK